jgi:hypothetical protein
MSEQQQQNSGTLVNVKRVRKDTDTKGREKVVLTFGLDKNGNNGADSLIAALAELSGKQINFDIRLEEKQTQDGATFTSAFVIVKEMVPKAEGGGKAKFVPKSEARTAQTKATAAKIKAQLD